MVHSYVDVEIKIIQNLLFVVLVVLQSLDFDGCNNLVEWYFLEEIYVS